VLVNQGKQNEAIAKFEKAIELEPANTVGYLTLGQVLALQGKYEDAVANTIAGPLP
jgi:predicted Zn-dependent protease